MLQAARYLVWLTRLPSSRPSPPRRGFLRPATSTIAANSAACAVTCGEIAIGQSDDCWHHACCSKSVTQNYDNRRTGDCADELAFAAGATLGFRTWKQLCAEWLKGKARVRTLISVIFEHRNLVV